MIPLWQGSTLCFFSTFGGSLDIFRLSWICVFKGMNGEPLGGCGGSQQPWWGLGEGRNLAVLTGELHYLGIVNNGLGPGLEANGH